jgi:hypothetical protein
MVSRPQCSPARTPWQRAARQVSGTASLCRQALKVGARLKADNYRACIREELYQEHIDLCGDHHRITVFYHGQGGGMPEVHACKLP